MNNLTKFYNKLTNEQINFDLSNFQFRRMINRFATTNASKLGNWRHAINKKSSSEKGHKFTHDDYNKLKEIIDAGYTADFYSDYLQIFEYDFELVNSFKNYPQLKKMYYNAVSIMSFRSLRNKHLAKSDRKKYFDVFNDKDFPYENFMKNHFVNKQIFGILVEFMSEMKPHMILNIENTFDYKNSLNIIYSSVICDKKLLDIPMNDNETNYYNYYISGSFDKMVNLFTEQELIWFFRDFNDFEQIDSYEMFNFLMKHNKQVNYALSEFDNYHDFKTSNTPEPEDIV